MLYRFKTTATVKPESTSKTTSQKRDEKEKLKIFVTKETKKYIKIIIVAGKKQIMQVIWTLSSPAWVYAYIRAERETSWARLGQHTLVS